MAIRHSLDVAARVSAELSEIIETLVNDPDREEAATLEEVRGTLVESGTAEAVQEESLHPQERNSVLAEIDGLIEEYGGEALAIDFVVAKASEGLSRIIEAAMDDVSLPDEPTLGAVREAMVNGLTARLIGDGVLDADEDATLLAEIDELIRHYGADAVAENFIRLE
ncbi:MAG: hypothetical protein HY323_03135 [Betaproteobacteria bacterium]|nr:hypothetical protein [Betaproteobacteria bacterium]